MSGPVDYQFPSGAGFIEADGVSGFANISVVVNIEGGDDEDYSFTLNGEIEATRVPWKSGPVVTDETLYTDAPNTFALGYERRQQRLPVVFIQTENEGAYIAKAMAEAIDTYEGEAGDPYEVEIKLFLETTPTGISLYVSGVSLADEDIASHGPTIHPRTLAGAASAASGAVVVEVEADPGEGITARTETYTFSIS